MTQPLSLKKIPLVQFPFESTTYTLPTWDDLAQLAFLLSQKMQKDGVQLDLVIALAKGGLSQVRLILDFMQVAELASLGIRFYDRDVIGQRIEKPLIYQELPAVVLQDIQKKKIAIFDDVADTGGSLEYAVNHLITLKIPRSNILTMTLYYKPHSRILPDYFGAQTDAWLIFPWEMRETIEILAKQWLTQGVTNDAMVQRFVTLGIKQEWTEYFLAQLKK